MDRKRRLALIFATVGIALGAGHIVQGGSGGTAQIATAALMPTEVTPVSAGPAKPAPAAQPAKPTIAPAATAAVPAEKPPVVTAPAPEPTAAPIVLAALTDPVAAAPAPAAPLPAPIVEACPVTLELLPEANAMIGIMLTAPCAADTRVVLRHAGLAITGKTSLTGSLFVSLPALDAKGEVSATLKGQAAVSGSVAMPGLAQVRRFGVQWHDADAFQLHAFENGAAFGAPGHVSAADPQKPGVGVGGYLTLLGDATVPLPMLAEIYTFPASGTPDVVLEAAITAKTCGRELLGETLTSTGGVAKTMDLSLATPDCTAIGDILVLNNLLSDPTMVAAN